MLDVLELAGSQGRAAVALNLHQSTVSRSSRLLQRQLRLRLRPGGLVCRYGQNACLQHLRLAYREHRLMEGVLRLSTDGLHQGLLGRLGGLQAVPPRFRSSEQWAELVRCGLLDGALLSSLGQESPPPRAVESPPAWPGLTALPLGELRLQLLGPCPSIQTVLLPPQRLAPRLHAAAGSWISPAWKTTGWRCANGCATTPSMASCASVSALRPGMAPSCSAVPIPWWWSWRISWPNGP